MGLEIVCGTNELPRAALEGVPEEFPEFSTTKDRVQDVENDQVTLHCRFLLDRSPLHHHPVTTATMSEIQDKIDGPNTKEQGHELSLVGNI